MNNPAVSILVPICNVEKYLRECLDSLVYQSLHDIEIICINDGSTDSSLEIIQEYANRDDRIVVIDKLNSGYGDSMNKGLDIARGKYVGIVESDDFASLNMFEVLYEAAERYQVDVVRTNYCAHITGESMFDDKLVPNLRKCTYNKVLSPMDDKQMFMCQPAIWTALYRKDMLNSASVRFLPTPGASFQDTAFYFKSLYAANKVILFKDGYLHYRIDNANSSVKNQNKIFPVCDEYAEVWRYAQKNAARFDQIKTWIPRQQFEAYLWNLNRLSPELRPKFYERFASEFKQIADAGLIDYERFEPNYKSFLDGMLADPEGFYVTEYGSKTISDSYLFFANNLEFAAAKETTLKLAQANESTSELFVVHPESDRIVFELKNEHRGLGALRSDADLSLHRVVGSFDSASLRGETAHILLQLDEAIMQGIASATEGQEEISVQDGFLSYVLKTDALWSDSRNQSSALFSLAQKLSTLKDIESNDVLSKLVSAFIWGVADADTFEPAVVHVKDMATALASLDVSYEVKLAAFKMAAPAWSAVRKSFGELPWKAYKQSRELFNSMAKAPAFAYPSSVATETPKVSVIIPVFNMEKYLQQCVDSVLAQEFNGFEVLLIDDGSTDNSLKLMQAYADKDSRVRVITQFNCGVGAARNRGIVEARGSKFIFIDPDDYYPSNRVFGALYNASIEKNVQICGGAFYWLETWGELKTHFDYVDSFYMVNEDKWLPLNEVWSDYGWIRFMYDATLFNEHGLRFPQLCFYEDPLFFLRALFLAGGCQLIPEPSYVYRSGIKPVNWSITKVRDLLYGVKINLEQADLCGLDGLYTTILKRLDLDFIDGLKLQLNDDGVFSELVDIQSSINESRVLGFDATDKGFYRLSVFCPEEVRRPTAIERFGSKVANSVLYKGMQGVMARLKDYL